MFRSAPLFNINVPNIKKRLFRTVRNINPGEGQSQQEEDRAQQEEEGQQPRGVTQAVHINSGVTRAVHINSGVTQECTQRSVTQGYTQRGVTQRDVTLRWYRGVVYP